MWSSFLLILLYVVQSNALLNNYTLGFVYPDLQLQTWARDSLRAFDLAVKEINLNSTYNSSFVLSYVFRDESTGNETLATSGVFDIGTLPNISLVGYLGTGMHNQLQNIIRP